jgi:anti-sigma factor RsiW
LSLTRTNRALDLFRWEPLAPRWPHFSRPLQPAPAPELIWPRRGNKSGVSAVTTNDDAPPSLRGYQLRHWNRGGMAFWAVSDLNDAELADFERALQG